jgi:hypothetical protein
MADDVRRHKGPDFHPQQGPQGRPGQRRRSSLPEHATGGGHREPLWSMFIQMFANGSDARPAETASPDSVNTALLNDGPSSANSTEMMLREQGSAGITPPISLSVEPRIKKLNPTPSLVIGMHPRAYRPGSSAAEAPGYSWCFGTGAGGSHGFAWRGGRPPCGDRREPL